MNEMGTPLTEALIERVYLVVAQVPPGNVASYGDIATIVGGCDARAVGVALNQIPKGREAQIPWQRIINASGGISTRGAQQRELLEAEGIEFNARGRVDLQRYRWAGPDEAWAAAHEMNTLSPQPSPPEQPGQLRLF